MTTEENLVWSNLAIHPGESLAEEMEFRGMSVACLAAKSGLSGQTLDQIIRCEKPITGTVAHGLATSLGTPAEFWLNLQKKYDLTLSRNERNQNSSSISEDLEHQKHDAPLHAGILRDPGSEQFD